MRDPCACVAFRADPCGVEGFPVERKLAAILAADVVGYSALMERDEEGTFGRVVAGRKEFSSQKLPSAMAAFSS